eukprot:1880122-Rhodomonas_salina.1
MTGLSLHAQWQTVSACADTKSSGKTQNRTARHKITRPNVLNPMRNGTTSVKQHCRDAESQCDAQISRANPKNRRANTKLSTVSVFTCNNRFRHAIGNLCLELPGHVIDSHTF